MADLEARRKAFSDFAKKIRDRTATRQNSFKNSNKRLSDSVQFNFTADQIEQLIQEGDPAQLRELSRYFARTSGVYKNSLLYLANFSLYQTVLTPVFNSNKAGNKNKILTTFYKALEFIDGLDIPVNFSRIAYEVWLSGIYYGILRGNGNNFTIQDLPAAFCRTRFKDFNNLDILEFDVRYFEKINNKEDQKNAIDSFPKIISSYYHKFSNKTVKNPWVEVPPEEGGMCFYLREPIPIFISSIPSILKFEDAQEREAKRDRNELYKLLVQKMPIGKDGELLYELPEFLEIHDAIADMLADLDTIDVLTVLGDTRLESVQDSTASAQVANKIEKYKKTAYDNLGMSSLIFNSEGSSSVPYSMQKDEALVLSLLNIFSNWLEYQVNARFSKPNLKFSFTILPTTVNNREKIQRLFFSGAQYGYSKTYAGVSLGIKQSNLISLMTFENDFLEMDEKMIPLRSSYTSSGKENSEKKAENKTKGPGKKDITNEGGRPPKELEDRSEKTILNQEGKG